MIEMKLLIIFFLYYTYESKQQLFMYNQIKDAKPDGFLSTCKVIFAYCCQVCNLL